MVITGEEYEGTYLGLQFSLSFGFSKLYGGVMDIQKESDAYLATLVQQEAITQHEFKDITYKPEINAFHSNYLSSHFVDNINWGWNAWQAAKASVVPEANKREGGYYIRDLRSPIGNCMKFWYQAGYGTKHKNFFWCETLEEAKKYRGGCTRFEIWHAPYIDSLVEYTVDFQLADRSVGLVDLNAQAVA